MKYLIVQLCDSSVSFCNYESSKEKNLIPISTLENALIWAVKNGLNIQILYPQYNIPDTYHKLIGKFEHIEIKSTSDADIIVLSDDLQNYAGAPVIYKTLIDEFLINYKNITKLLQKVSRLNICFTDIQNFKDEQEEKYEVALLYLSDSIEKLFREGNNVQLNLITDRMMLTDMNNCNAGVESVTLAPDGNFYICPAFYFDKSKPLGNLESGLLIPNPQLYKVDFAPICRVCDAFQCKRCVWLNKKLTYEVNTPGHQQCLMSHIERRISKNLLERLRRYGDYAPDVEIQEIDYIDPYDKIVNKNQI